MISLTTLVWFFLGSALLITFLFFKSDRRGATLSIGIGVTGWVLDSQSGFGFIAYGLQVSSAILALLFVFPKKDANDLGPISKVLQSLQLCSYLFIGSQVIAALVSNSGFEGIIRATLLTLLIATFRNYLSDGKRNLDLPLFIASLACLTIILDSIFSITQVSLTEIGGGRSGGIIGHPNYAAYLAAASCIVWYIRKQNWLSIAAVLVTGFASILTLSRTAILGLFISLLLVSIQKRKVAQASFLSIATFAAILFQSNLTNLITERFGWIIDSGGLFGANSAGWRALQWATTISVINDRQAAPVGWKESGQYLLSGLEPHNYFLQSLLELGVIGLAAALGFITVFASGFIQQKNIGPFLLIALGSIFDAGLLVPSFFVGSLILLATPNDYVPTSKGS